jgi:hypothetical protein
VQNDIPVFCPGLTDGSIGDMIYFHSYQNEGLIVDIAQGALPPPLLHTIGPLATHPS